ncbi:GntR family transcriptional regulator [Castellaniella sp.]|uniref:GntR family transcriptional regulator n=1 Tax=Castellaniella sp. TaxID=1955812 RepID=UPI0035640571
MTKRPLSRDPEFLQDDGTPENEDLRDRVYRLLEEAIVSGEIGPGERLDERLFAQKYGVSRTPVREALNRLVSAGLAIKRGRLGTFVSTISVTELFQTFEVMAELESLCARLSAQRMSIKERKALRALAEFATSDQPPSLGEYVVQNRRFHEMIYQGSHNPVLEELANMLFRRIARYRHNTLKASGRILASIEEHRDVAQAIFEGDARKAGELMQFHIDIRRLDHADFVMFITRLNEQGER